MLHTVIHNYRFTFPAIAALVLALAVPFTATAFDPASQDCKECVMKGVMKDGRLFRECIRPNKAYHIGVCDGLCINVDRNALRKELKEQASAQCDTTRKSCLDKAGEDRHKLLLCEGAYNECKQHLNGFNDFH
jgi:hypothetical protein